MTLNEAIKTLEQERKDHHSFPTDIIGKAEALGGEALKAFNFIRENDLTYASIMLPGETAE